MDNFAVDFNRKCNQISDMLTHIHNQRQIREETNFQPQIAAGVGAKNQSFSCSYDLRTPMLESPHLQPSSSFLSVPPLSQNYLPPPPIMPYIPKVFAHDTDETTTIMTGDKVLDEMPNSEIVVCDGGMIETKIANGIGVFSEDAGVLINSGSIQALRKQVVVTSFSQNKVAIIDEWKVLDKMSLREIGVAVEEGKTRCLDDEISLKIEVVDTARPIPKLHQHPSSKP